MGNEPYGINITKDYKLYEPTEWVMKLVYERFIAQMENRWLEFADALLSPQNIVPNLRVICF